MKCRGLSRPNNCHFSGWMLFGALLFEMSCYCIYTLEMREQDRELEFRGLIHTKQLRAASPLSGNTHWKLVYLRESFWNIHSKPWLFSSTCLASVCVVAWRQYVSVTLLWVLLLPFFAVSPGHVVRHGCITGRMLLENGMWTVEFFCTENIANCI